MEECVRSRLVTKRLSAATSAASRSDQEVVGAEAAAVGDLPLEPLPLAALPLAAGLLLEAGAPVNRSQLLNRRIAARQTWRTKSS
jgi:hypothetical protein